MSESPPGRSIGCFQLPGFGNPKELWLHVHDYLSQEERSIDVLVLRNPEFPDSPSKDTIERAGNVASTHDIAIVIGSTVVLPDGQPTVLGSVVFEEPTMGFMIRHVPDLPGFGSAYLGISKHEACTNSGM